MGAGGRVRSTGELLGQVAAALAARRPAPTRREAASCVLWMCTARKAQLSTGLLRSKSVRGEEVSLRRRWRRSCLSWVGIGGTEGWSGTLCGR
jgi:hypothetical protein